MSGMHQKVGQKAALMLFPRLLACAALWGFLWIYPVAAQPLNYAVGDKISAEVTVADKDGSSVSLLQLFAAAPGNLNVLFIFGGGDLGSGQPGHLWCQDSFEDTQILRTLVGKYADSPVNFIPVASAPVYHSQMLGQPAGVFLTAAKGSAEFETARAAFVQSTLAAREVGILPVTPYFDFRFSLMLNRDERFMPSEGYGKVADWHGAFRSPAETQFYGVPSFWIVADSGEILAEPFRGNLYHPHGSDVTIHYTYTDVDRVLNALLEAE